MDSVPTWLLVFVLDLNTSSEAIAEVRRKLQSFRNEILNDPTANKSVELAVIAVGSTARVLIRPTSANRCIVPVLQPTTESSLPEGAQAGLSLIKTRLDYYQQQTIAHKTPVLCLLTDNPTDAKNALVAILDDTQARQLTSIVVKLPHESDATGSSATQSDYASWAGFSWAGLPTLISGRTSKSAPEAQPAVAREEAPRPVEAAPMEYPSAEWAETKPTIELDWMTLRPREQLIEQAIEQEINCSTYAPHKVQPGEDFMIVATLHPSGNQKASDSLAKRIDPRVSSVGTKPLLETLRAGQHITFRLLVKGASVDQPAQHIKWRGNLTSVEFIVTLPATCDLPNLYASLAIFRDSVPLGSFKFSLAVTKTQPENQQQSPGFQPFRKAFISYSSKDRDEVLKRVQGIESIGQKVFVDLMNLASGERWESRLYEQIESSDVFYLFWSTEAKQSKWVKQEWQYALNLLEQRTNQFPEIIPILIEGPPPPSPPRSLRHLHFNDRYLYFIGK